jgi:hypothetical protein
MSLTMNFLCSRHHRTCVVVSQPAVGRVHGQAQPELGVTVEPYRRGLLQRTKLLLLPQHLTGNREGRILYTD